MTRNASGGLDGKHALSGDAFTTHPLLHRLLPNAEASRELCLATCCLNGFVDGGHAAEAYRHCLSECKALPVSQQQASPVPSRFVVKSKRKPERPELKPLGVAIASAREAVGLKQEKLGETLGVTQQTVGQWELGQAAIGVEKLPALAKALETSVGKLFGENPVADESQLVTIHGLSMPIEAARLGQQWALMDEPARSLYRDLIYLIVAAQKRQPNERKKAKGKPIGITELLAAAQQVENAAS